MAPATWLYSRSSIWILVAIVLLVVSGSLGEENTQFASRRTKRPSTGPTLVSRGEKLPLYNAFNDPDAPTLLDGIRTLGEWMKAVGLSAEEESFVESHLDPSEPLEFEFGDSDDHETQFKSITRDDAKSNRAEAAGVIPTPPLVCSRRGVLVNKTGSVVRIVYLLFSLFLRYRPWNTGQIDQIPLRTR